MTTQKTAGQKNFTFQSGSIQMPLKLYKEDATGGLYIPIWFYSNTEHDFRLVAFCSFTFQSGSIQIKNEQFDTSTAIFTFQSGSIQIGDVRQNGHA